MFETKNNFQYQHHNHKPNGTELAAPPRTFLKLLSPISRFSICCKNDSTAYLKHLARKLRTEAKNADNYVYNEAIPQWIFFFLLIIVVIKGANKKLFYFTINTVR
jgi:hypothetical protein